MDIYFFQDWPTLGKVALTTIIAFVTLFLFVRISGKRTLSKLNAFDFVVSIALGSTLSDMMLAVVPAAEGAAVLFLIILLQYAFAWLARLSPKMERIINTVPAVVYYDNNFLTKTMAREAITKEEIYAAIRSSGIDQLHEVKAVIMELNGSMSVIKKSALTGPSSMDDLEIKK